MDHSAFNIWSLGSGRARHRSESGRRDEKKELRASPVQESLGRPCHAAPAHKVDRRKVSMESDRLSAAVKIAHRFSGRTRIKKGSRHVLHAETLFHLPPSRSAANLSSDRLLNGFFVHASIAVAVLTTPALFFRYWLNTHTASKPIPMMSVIVPGSTSSSPPTINKIRSIQFIGATK